MTRMLGATLATMMMREAAYSGREVKAEWLLSESKRIWGPEGSPAELEFGERAVEPVAVPGEYELE